MNEPCVSFFWISLFSFMIFRGKKDNHGLLCEEVLEQKIEGKLMQNSDDETLSSVLK